MRTFLTEARRIEAACARGELLPDLLSDALRWWLYTHPTRRPHGPDHPVWRPPVFRGGTYQPRSKGGRWG